MSFREKNILPCLSWIVSAYILCCADYPTLKGISVEFAKITFTNPVVCLYRLVKASSDYLTLRQCKISLVSTDRIALSFLVRYQSVQPCK